MRQIPVILDSHIRLDGNLIGHDLTNDIFDELTFDNKAKEIARAADRYGWWDLPDKFNLGGLDGDTLVLPRGYALQLKLLLRENNLRPWWIDRRKWKKGLPLQWASEFNPREHQPYAVAKMIKHQQGMYEAPTGSGKSLSCLYAIQQLSPEYSIILVDKIGLLNQWSQEVENWFGFKCGVIGGSKWSDDARITVATVQTIWSAIKKDQVPNDFFKKFSLSFLDECHHATATSIQEIVGRFWAKYREGVSAAPDRKDDRFLISLSVLGEVFHKDDEKILQERGVLVKPRVQAIRTEFMFDYWPDHQSDTEHHCQVSDCKLNGRKKHSHRNNYQQLKNALVSDDKRNLLICETVWQQVKLGNHHHLIITDEVRHVEAIYMKLLAEFPHIKGLPSLYVLTGKVKGDKRKQLIEEIKTKKSSVIISTVAKEGLNIPVIDRIYLPFPSSNPISVQQKIGRGTRTSEGKTDSVIFDFQDINVGLLKKQFKNRANQCYRKLGIQVIL